MFDLSKILRIRVLTIPR